MTIDSALFDAVRRLKPEALTSRIDGLVANERSLVCELLVHLAELERRELHLELGYASLFAYCTDHLRLSKGSAYRRFTAARLIARFPQIIGYLRSGQLCLTTLCLLKDVLTPGRCAELLERAAGRTEAQVQMLVASLNPQPAPTDSIRRLPAPRPSARAEVRPPVDSGSGPEPGALPEPSRSGRRPSVKPLSAERSVLRMTVGAEFVRELEEVKQALSHQIPGGELEKVLRECIRVTLDKKRKKRQGAGRPRRSRPKASSRTKPSEATRDVPAELRGAVWKRDESSCSYVGPDGRRCGSKHQLEIHHRIAFARGGPLELENLQLLCRAHNAHLARQDFGAEHMARAIAGEPDG